MKRSALAAILAMAAVAVPEGSSSTAPSGGMRPRRQRTRPNGMRRASVRPWNDRENERRRRQIERGIIRLSLPLPESAREAVAR